MSGLLALRALASLAGGVFLWLGWRAATRGADSWAARLITLGLLTRALLGCALFWTSWLELPVARSVQLGGGYWEFALDADDYVHLARDAASQGLDGIAGYDRLVSSVSFVQVLALAQLLWGEAPSAGLMLNCLMFLGGALLLRRWMDELGPAGRAPGLLSLAVVALQPSWVLWATQPLKDALFLFLVIVWFHAARRLLGSLRGAGVPAALGWALPLALAAYLMAGLRGYCAVMLWVALGAILVLGLLRSRLELRRRLSAAAVCALLWVALSQVIAWSGGPLLPAYVLAVLRPWGTEVEGTSGSTPVQAVATARVGFVGSGGNTQIHSPRSAERDRPPGTRPSARERVPVAPAAPMAPPPREERPSGAVPAATPGSLSTPRELVDAAPTTAPVEPARPPEALSIESLAAGLSAIFLPRVVGRALRLYDAGGSASSWLLAEVDTVCLLAAVACSGWLTFRAVRRQRRLTALAVGTLLFGLTLAVLLALVVTNFGTLFRLREMVLLPLALTPLAATAWRPDPGRACAATAPG